MTEKRLRAGIVGCGGIARAHLAAYQAVDGIDVAVVYDIAGEAAETLAAIAGPGTYVAKSIEDMIANGVDAVSVCSPPGAHLESCLALVGSGIPVLCEKPLERDADRAAEIAEAVRRSDTPFVMAFCHRFHPPVIELKKLIDSGILGHPLFFRNIFSGAMDLAPDHRSRPVISGGGTMIDTSSHSVDLFRFLVGEPTEVSCLIGNVAQDLPVEDLCALIVSVGGKAFGEISASHSLAVGSNELAWYGTNGTAIIEYWDKLSYQIQGQERAQVVCPPAPGRFERQIGHFVACVRGWTLPTVTVDDGLAASRIISAAYQSAAIGQAVSLASRTPGG